MTREKVRGRVQLIFRWMPGLVPVLRDIELVVTDRGATFLVDGARRESESTRAELELLDAAIRRLPDTLPAFSTPRALMEDAGSVSVRRGATSVTVVFPYELATDADADQNAWMSVIRRFDAMCRQLTRDDELARQSTAWNRWLDEATGGNGLPEEERARGQRELDGDD